MINKKAVITQSVTGVEKVISTALEHDAKVVIIYLSQNGELNDNSKTAQQITNTPKTKQKQLELPLKPPIPSIPMKGAKEVSKRLGIGRTFVSAIRGQDEEAYKL